MTSWMISCFHTDSQRVGIKSLLMEKPPSRVLVRCHFKTSGEPSCCCVLNYNTHIFSFVFILQRLIRCGFPYTHTASLGLPLIPRFRITHKPIWHMPASEAYSGHQTPAPVNPDYFKAAMASGMDVEQSRCEVLYQDLSCLFVSAGCGWIGECADSGIMWLDLMRHNSLM